MEFVEKSSHCISNYSKFEKYLIVVETIKDGKVTEWVDIRTRINDGMEARSTKEGVFLTRDEFGNLRNIMPTEHEIQNGTRQLSFKRNTAFEFLYDLKVTKHDGKESKISLTLKDIEKIREVDLNLM